MSFAMHLKPCGKLFLAFFVWTVVGLDQDPGLVAWMSRKGERQALVSSFPHLKILMFVSVLWTVCNQDLLEDTHRSLSNLSTVVAKLFFLDVLQLD